MKNIGTLKKVKLVILSKRNARLFVITCELGSLHYLAIMSSPNFECLGEL